MLEKKHPAKDYQYWYGERTDIPFKKVQESRENDIYIRSHQNAENYSKIGLVFYKTYS